MTEFLGPAEWEAVRLSIRVATWAVLASLPIALFVAYALARWTFPGRQVLNSLVHLPLILPPVATGYVLLILFGGQGPLGRVFETVFGITFAFRWTGAALAAAIMAFPLIVRAIRLAIEAVDPGLEDAAATLGANRFWRFVLVTLPLIAPGILAGIALGFAKAMGEFGATITFVSNIPGETRTLPTAIYTALQVPGGEAAALWLVAISVAIALLAVFLSDTVSERLARRIRGR